ncbi:hypothetical protein ES705_22904 [subsurface metagenome]
MFRQKSILYIITVFLILCLTSCGLYNITTLNPPLFAGIDDVDNYFKFRATGEYDSDYFRGFELYYKIYLQEATVDSNLLSLSELTSKGFKRIAGYSDRINIINKPLIPIDSANHDDTFDITVDFDGLEVPTTPTEPFAAGETVAPLVSFSIELRRGIADKRIGHADEFKPFSVFEEGDANTDISIEIWNAISGNNDVTLVIYALSYGKQELIIDVYSIAVYLFEIDIKLPH